MPKKYRPCARCGEEIEVRGRRMYCYSCSDAKIEENRERRPAKNESDQ